MGRSLEARSLEARSLFTVRWSSPNVLHRRIQSFHFMVLCYGSLQLNLRFPHHIYLLMGQGATLEITLHPFQT